MSKNLILPLIIDNITTKLTHIEYIDNLKHTFNDITFDIKILNKGGIVITPNEQQHINKFLDTTKYNPDIYGNTLDIHVIGESRDLRPWLCINKINTDTPLDIVKNKLETLNNNINIKALHRKRKGPYDTTLILFKTTDHTVDNTLINKQITINNNKCYIRKYINAGQIRCSKCNRIGHLKNKCKNTKTCVMCAGNDCPDGKCKSSLRECVNCTQAHPSSFPNCPAIKSHIKHQFNIKRQTNIELNQDNIINSQTKINTELTNRINTLEQLINKQAHESKTLLDTQININKENCNQINNNTIVIKELQEKLDKQLQINIKINKDIDDLKDGHNELVSDINRDIESDKVIYQDIADKIEILVQSINKNTIELENTDIEELRENLDDLNEMDSETKIIDNINLNTKTLKDNQQHLEIIAEHVNIEITNKLKEVEEAQIDIYNNKLIPLKDKLDKTYKQVTKITNYINTITNTITNKDEANSEEESTTHNTRSKKKE